MAMNNGAKNCMRANNEASRRFVFSSPFFLDPQCDRFSSIRLAHLPEREFAEEKLPGEDKDFLAG